MEKYHVEVEKEHLRIEKEAVKELRNAYKQALEDIQERIIYLKSDEALESKIRQLNYQKALETQITGVLDVLKTDNIITINKYLNEAYNNGFVGSLYCMQKENIPIAFGIDEKKVLTSISKKIENMTFADREETNMDDFKKKVKAEITRGFANGSKYSEIVRNLNNVTKEGVNSSYRICRTEMGRVSQEAKYDSMVQAKKNGADIVKQWDSTMDGHTRETHQKLDGQVKELDEPFEIDEMQAMYPMGFGIASMDINCRCVVLERARWAVEDELNGNNTFTKAVRNNDGTTEIREFNTDSYNEFKKDYFKWEKEVKEVKQELNTINEINNYAKIILSNAYENTRIENKLTAVPIEQLGNDYIKVDFGNVDTKIANEFSKQTEYLTNKYNSSVQEIKQTILLDPLGRYEKGIMARTELNTSVNKSSIFIQDNLTDYEKFIERMNNNVSIKYIPNIKEEDYVKYLITHEYGHSFSLIDKTNYGVPYKSWIEQDMKSLKQFDNGIKLLFNEYTKELKELNTQINEYTNKLLFGTLTKEDEKIVNELNDKYSELLISKYSLTNVEEFMAEGFADAELGTNPSKYSIEIHKLINQYFKR